MTPLRANTLSLILVLAATLAVGEAATDMFLSSLPSLTEAFGTGTFGCLTPVRSLDGNDIGLVSEAGMPAIADPGASVVRAAHRLALQVVPLVGPISLMLVLAASGLNGQNFAFVGYLPQEPAARAARVRDLERLALSTGQTQLFIETPYRNAAMLQTLLQALAPSTRIAIGSALTLPQAQVRCRAVREWREAGAFTDKNTPAVFAIGR